MIKRQNWAVSYGGGEYGSEDSSDSDLDEEEAEDENVLSTAASSLSWAESVKVTEEISSDEEDGINLYANVALRGPMQVGPAFSRLAGRAPAAALLVRQRASCAL